MSDLLDKNVARAAIAKKSTFKTLDLYRSQIHYGRAGSVSVELKLSLDGSVEHKLVAQKMDE